MTKSYLLFLFVVLLSIFGCDKAADFSDNYTYGSYLKYRDVAAKTAAETSALFDYNNLSASTLKVDYEVVGQPSKIEIYWDTAGGNEILVKELPLTATSVTVTALELAKALNSAYTSADDLKQHSNLVGLGKRARLVVYTYKGDTKLETKSELVSGSAYLNFKIFQISFICPFVADDAVGTYLVDVDAWQDLKKGDEVEVIKITNTTIAIKGFPKPTGSVKNSDTTFLNVNPASGSTKVDDKSTLNYGSYGSGSTVYSVRGGSGLVFSCTGVIDIKVDFASAATGSVGFPGYALRLIKK